MVGGKSGNWETSEGVAVVHEKDNGGLYNSHSNGKTKKRKKDLAIFWR